MKCYLTCLLFLADIILTVLPSKTALSHLYAQLLVFRGDTALLRSALTSICLATQLNDRRETYAETLQEEIIFWTAFDLGFRMNSRGDEQWLLTRCLFRIAREGEIVLPSTWLNGWKSGKHNAQSGQMVMHMTGEYPEYTDASEGNGDG